MKYTSFFSILFSALISIGTLTAQNTAGENTEIRLHVDGLAAAWVQLQSIHENVKSKLDSVQLNDKGDAVFKYNQRLEPGYYEILLPDSASISLLLDEDQTVELTTKKDGLIENMRVVGNLENTLLYNILQYDINLGLRFQAEIEALQSEGAQTLDENFVNQLRQKYFREREYYYAGLLDRNPNTLFAKFEQAKQTPVVVHRIMADPSLDDATRQQLLLSSFWDNVDFNDDRLLRTPVIFDKLWEYFNRYVPNQTDIKIQAVDILMGKVSDHPAYYQFFATWITENYLPPFTGMMDPDALYIHMVDNYLTYERAFWADSLKVYTWQLRGEDQRASLVGEQGADFTACDTKGEKQSLYAVEAPYIALFFYHTDCDHCIETTPKLVEKYRELKDRGLEVVAVAMSTPDEEWKAFIEKNEMNWINLTDQDNPDIYKKYFVRATPEIYLINPDRKIIGKHLDVEDIPLVMQMDQMEQYKKAEAGSSEK